MYELLMKFLLPMCIPLGIAAIAAFAAKSRVVFFVPIFVAALFTLFSSPAREYSNYAPGTSFWQMKRDETERQHEHKREAAFWAGLLTTIVTLTAVEISSHLSRRQQPPKEGAS